MKDPLTIAAVQFEMAQDDKPANLAVMARFIEQAAAKSVDVLLFPELCTAGYHFLTTSPKEKLLQIAERIPNGETVRYFEQLARKHHIAIIFGMLELTDDHQHAYNTAVVVTPEGFLFKHRKVHAFEHSCVLQGDKLDTFDLLGWRCGILICYDNNLPENNRILALKGAEIIFAPHQTGGFDIAKAGMGRIPLELWQNRRTDSGPLRQAILGPKGREWLLKWLPSRSYDNNVFTIFANGVGIDGPEVRPGCNMIIDPEGLILAETTDPADAMILATCSKSAHENSLPSAHMLSRRPSLYGPLTAPTQEIDTRTIRNRVSGEQIK